MLRYGVKGEEGDSETEAGIESVEFPPEEVTSPEETPTTEPTPANNLKLNKMKKLQLKELIKEEIKKILEYQKKNQKKK
jgi:hypothetical protein